MLDLGDRHAGLLALQPVAVVPVKAGEFGIGHG